MKYMLKRIFIGVAIGTILFLIKGGNVFAASNYKYLYDFDTKSVNADFDICEHNDYNSLCINGFSKSFSFNRNNQNYITLYVNNDKVIGLRNFSVSFVNNNSDLMIYRYGNLTYNLQYFFDSTSSTGRDSNRLFLNNFLSYVKITTQDNVVCEITNNIGVNVSTSYNPPALLPYFEVPSECRSKYLKQIDFIFQSGYNYTGSNNIFNPIEYESGMSNQNYINTNRNNTYLLSWGISDKTNKNVVFKGNFNNAQLYFNSSNNYVGTTPILQTYTITDQEINENLAELNKQIYFASLGGTDLGPNMPSSENQDDVNNSILGLSSQIGTSLSTASFQDFLSALIQKPISELLWVIRTDNVDSENKIIKCPTIYLPFKVNHNNHTSEYGMYLPCMSNIYGQIPYVMSYNYDGTFGLVTIYHIVLHGYLYYLLVLTWLNLVKYTVTRSSSEIEVLEL